MAFQRPSNSRKSVKRTENETGIVVVTVKLYKGSKLNVIKNIKVADQNVADVGGYIESALFGGK